MKTGILATALLIASGTVALAQYTGPSDLRDGDDGKYAVTKVDQILAGPRDDLNVQLEGRLIHQLRKDAYTFTDGTGEIRVDIDSDEFPAVEVNDTTTIRIQGEVDTHRDRAPEIDVERVMVIR